jgi:hypothetical protein
LDQPNPLVTNYYTTISSNRVSITSLSGSLTNDSMYIDGVKVESLVTELFKYTDPVRTAHIITFKYNGYTTNYIFSYVSNN